MNASDFPRTEHDFIRSLFGPYALVLTPVEGRLVARAVSSQLPEKPGLSFQLAFDDVLPGGQQYAALETLQARLTQPLPYDTFWQGYRSRQRIVLFTRLHLDADTERISGDLNPHLRLRWLQLAGEFNAAELESLFMLRWANRPHPHPRAR